MKDAAGLLHLAFKLAREVSETGLDLERAPGLRARRAFADRIADAAVSALAHVAAASDDFTSDPSYRGRQRATTSLRGAREELRKLHQVLKTVEAQHYLDAEQVRSYIAKVDELTVIVTALAVEVSGNRFAA